MTKEKEHDGFADSNHRQCIGYRPSCLGNGRDRACAGGGWRRLGVAAPALSAGPALVSEAVVALFGQNQMIEEGDAEQFTGLAQPFGQDAVFGARRDVTGGVIVGTNPGAGVHQDQWLEDLARMYVGQCERVGGDDIDPDQTMFPIYTTDDYLFPFPSG